MFMGKLVGNTVKVTIVQWIVLPLSAIFFDFNLFVVLLPMLAVLFVHGLGLTLLGTLFSAVVSRVGRGETGVWLPQRH